MRVENKVADTDRSIDIQNIINTLFFRKFIITATTIILLMAVGYYLYKVAVPEYESSSVLMLNNQKENVIDIPGVLGDISNDIIGIRTEAEVLRSRILMGKVVDELQLIDDPEFNASLREENLTAKIKGLVKTLLHRNGPDPDQPLLSEEERLQRRKDSVITSLLGHLEISVIPNTTTYMITARSIDPEKSALIADTVAKTYVESQVEVKREATVQAVSWLSSKVEELQFSLEQSEIKVKEFTAKNPMVSSEIVSGLERQLKATRDRIAAAREAKRNASERLRLLQNAEGFTQRAAIADDAELDHLAVTAARSPVDARQFEARYERILTQMQQTVASSENQLTTLVITATSLEKQIAANSNDLIELQQLAREAEANRLLYEYFLSRLKETSAQQGIQQSESRILSNAVIPSGPYKPNKKVILVITAFAGFVIGSGLALLLEAQQHTFRATQELEDFTGIPVLGQIPLMPIRQRQSLLDYLREKPTSAAAEAIRNLRTSILLSKVDNPPQVIMLTSSTMGEGKTSLSIALAHNFSGMGKKVLLIEGDIRRRIFNEYFNGPVEAGFLSVLTGKAALDEVIKPVDEYGIDVLYGDPSGTNAADVFSSDRFKVLLEEVRKRYDVIVIDTPPTLVVPDPRIIAQEADVVLFVVKWDSTAEQQTEAALHLFENLEKGVDGTILNQIDPKRMRRYGYEYSYDSGYYDN